MKILIVGTDFNSYLLSEFIKAQTPQHDVFVTQGGQSHDNDIIAVDIRPENISELKDFVKYNDIDFTVVFSENAINEGFADEFLQNGLPVFAPCSAAAASFFNNGAAKKLLYKLKVPAPRFGIFDKENSALDYVKNAKYPIFIKNDCVMFERYEKYCSVFSKAKLEVQKIFEEPGKRIVIENTDIDEQYYYIYFITDGYDAYPLIGIKREYNDDVMTFSSSPGKISEHLTVKILRNVIYPLIDDISKFSSSYAGIIGVKATVRGESYQISELYPWFQKFDMQAFLSLIDCNFADVLYAVSCGKLRETGDYIPLKDKISYSVVTDNSQIQNHAEEDNCLFTSTHSGKSIFTAVAPSVSSAKSLLADEIFGMFTDEIYGKISEFIMAEDLKI